MVRTKIHDLVNAGDDDELEAFFEEDQDHKKLVNEADAVGWTPLHHASSKGHNKMVRLLLAQNADPNVATEVDGWTASHDAARTGNAEALKDLQKAGGNIERASSSGTRPLHYAIQYGQTKCVDSMLQEGCDIDSPNNLGWSPLHFAARYGQKDICVMLLDRGACPTTADKLGRSCESLAAWVRDSLKEGKAAQLKLNENVKADTIEEMMGMLKEAADQQAAEALKMAQLAMENYKSSFSAEDLHGALEHLIVAKDNFLKARENEQVKSCEHFMQDLNKKIKDAMRK